MGYCTSNIKSPRYRFIDWIFYFFFFFFLADLQTMQYFIACTDFMQYCEQIFPPSWFGFLSVGWNSSKAKLDLSHTLYSYQRCHNQLWHLGGNFFFPLINDSGNSGKGANTFSQNCRETSIIIWLVKSSRELKVIFT